MPISAGIRLTERKDIGKQGDHNSDFPLIKCLTVSSEMPLVPHLLARQNGQNMTDRSLAKGHSFP